MINNNIIIFIILISLAIDLLYGELPTIAHPVVIIGNLIEIFKKRLIKIKNKSSGMILTICICGLSAFILYVIYYFICLNNILFIIISSVILSTTFSIKMLLDTASDVKKELDKDINKARESLSYLVSRNTDELSESFIVSAVIETLTENITDSYTAVLFYYTVISIIIVKFNLSFYFLLSVPLLYRIFNTLDAMLGYKTDELINIGFVPAKIDDILNFIPSRLSGLFIVASAFILGYDYKNSFTTLINDAGNCPSPNSGYTMAPAAGALDIQLVKKDTYVLGDDINEISKDDISKAVRLSKMTIILFTITFILILTGVIV